MSVTKTIRDISELTPNAQNEEYSEKIKELEEQMESVV